MDWNDLTTLVNYESFARGLGYNLVALDEVSGFKIRPGFFLENGAVVIPGGVSFTVHSQNATAVSLVLFRREGNEPYAIIPYPQKYRIGYVYSMIVFGLDIEEFEYAFSVDGPNQPEKGLLFDSNRLLIDPYSKAVAGQSRWGERNNTNCHYKSRVVANDFDWGNSQSPQISMDDLIIYEMHVRGFTYHSSSGVQYPGTFSGLADKIPYLLDLGINAVELMPIFEFDEMRDVRDFKGQHLLDYWGYNPVSFFAPNTGYTAGIEYNREGIELKQLIRKFHENGIEVILDVVFNHTAEGNENGPVISFKGFDNNVYYMLSPDGKYYNFSGCGNTLNCNHPVVQQMIIECLRYWVTEYRIDGFRFDLASILGRNEDGSPMSKPPLLQSLAFDPILANVKLIAEAWDAGGLYQVGSFPSWSRWSEWNGRYRDDMRCFLKGDTGLAAVIADRLAGSRDLYDPLHRGKNASVNFITCHDGFTLRDLYSYNYKHNEANGWGNSDGDNHNNSWNCGAEGETNNPQIIELRNRLVRNSFTALLCSRGTPMLLSGDEFGNTQTGNNNAYCQDNEISWLDWSNLTKNKDLFEFVKKLIQLRHRHPAMRNNLDPARCGLPSFSKHGLKAWFLDPNPDNRLVAVMFTGFDAARQHDDIIYLVINAHWEAQTLTLPRLPGHLKWLVAVDSSLPVQEGVTLEPELMKKAGPTIKMIGRSIMVLIGQ